MPGLSSRGVDGSGPQDRWGRAAARTLPTRVGTGCRPSVTSPRVGGIGSTPERIDIYVANGFGIGLTPATEALLVALRARAKVITAGA